MDLPDNQRWAWIIYDGSFNAQIAISLKPEREKKSPRRDQPPLKNRNNSISH